MNADDQAFAAAGTPPGTPAPKRNDAASPLGFKEKLGYGLGDTASHFVWDMVGFWLLFFYTDVYKIPAAAAGTIMLVARFWDMAIDPVIGIVSDRTQARVVADVIATEVAADATADAQPPQAVVVTCPDQLAPATSRALENRGIDAPVFPFPGGDPRFVDWVDYADRNSTSDPVTFVENLRAELDDSTTVYAVINTTYLTFEDKCEGLLAALGENGAPMELLVAADGQNFFEGMSLWVRRPSS